MLILLTQIDKLFAWYIFSSIRRRTFYLEFIRFFLPFSPFKRPISLKVMQEEAISLQIAQLCETEYAFWAFFTHLVFLKQLEEKNGNLAQSYSTIRKSGMMERSILLKVRQETKKGKLDWGTGAESASQPPIFLLRWWCPFKSYYPQKSSPLPAQCSTLHVKRTFWWKQSMTRSLFYQMLYLLEMI